MPSPPPRFLILAALAGLLALALPQPSRAQSAASVPPGAAAACDPSPDPLATATCADPAARLADRRRALAHEALRHQLHPAQRAGLEADARAFGTFLQTHCLPQGRADPACIARAHAAKREDLRRWLQPPATDEADRDPVEAEALAARLAARGIPQAPPEAQRDAIAALQRQAGLPPTGFLDSATAALAAPAPPPAPAGALPPDAVWLPRFPAALNTRFALTGCDGPAISWAGNALRIGEIAEPGESYEIFADPERFYLLPPAGPARILEGLADGTLRLSGAIPPALARRGVRPGTILRRCG
ncbi:hypothetical protein J8J14_16930 [Roseomonas sp. SSH11]|uniref:Uncharacterized protein n=1 Tax=Pararoseomonas baculiformis TaxID=2820812 RepID=A0ABS4AHF3_9PROT|nr:hypothetical protein [Pararoseomonas baculiformis]MBP0446462.1 hypothetical protein [Pararoseomonas baculiformis]